MATTRLSRRRFIAGSASLAGSVVADSFHPLFDTAAAQPSSLFRSAWALCPDRVWLGPDCWANPLQDWRIAAGRVECSNAAMDRNVHVLTRQLGARKGNLVMSVRVGRVEGGALGGARG